jgi:predicted esterase
MLFGVGLIAANAQAIESYVLLKNGLMIGPGETGSVTGVDQSPNRAAALNGGINAKPITVVDDNLRMTFFRTTQVQSINNRAEPPTVLQTKNADLRASGTHPRVAAVQGAFGVTPFDDFGRRIYSLTTPNGPARIQQGITEVSSRYLRVEGLNSEHPTLWDMRLPLNAIGSDQLRKILFNQVDLNAAQNWLDIVTIFSQAERYRDAREVLQMAIRQHPELENLRPKLREFDELNAELMFREVEIRSRAGQHQLARTLLGSFKRSDVAAVTNAKIDARLTAFRAEDQSIKDIKERCKKLLGTTTDQRMLEISKRIVDEIDAQLSYDTIRRFSDLQQIAGTDDERALAVAISNWLLGGGSSVNSLPVATSLVTARDLVAEYLSTNDSSRRGQILDELRAIEGGTTPYIAKIAKLMRPPLSLETQAAVPGRFDVEVPVTALPQSPVTRYSIQLPPEYDPNHKYPCILALHGELAGPQDELAWWTGDYNEQFSRCMGEASRRGYIVVVPHWRRPKQPFYTYTENEHAIILASFRDACRRSSIDTNRVYLSGHYSGGDAAWDIGLAHPDLWAGLIVIGGNCEKFPVLYTENAKSLPMYFVMGELDGAPNALSRNGKYLDKFLSTAMYDCMIVAYKGRGRDHFQEELGRIMEWTELSAHRRNFYPNSFEVVTARPGDNFFWFLELRGINPNILIHPLQYEGRSLPKIDAMLRKPNANAVRIGSLPAQGFDVWLSPGHVQDINQRIIIETSRGSKPIQPDLNISVILEDLRRRADREEPFWIHAEF